MVEQIEKKGEQNGIRYHKNMSSNDGSLNVGNWGSVSVGIAFVIISLICRYGAEIGGEVIKAK